MRVEGTPLVCDAPRTAGALVFLSHPEVAAALTTSRSPLKAAQVLLTPMSAGLLTAAGHDLGTRALVTAYGRPFALGTLRVELFPSGVAPGSASLLCEGPAGRFVFAGPIRLQSPPPATAAAEIRPADAVCVDATYADAAWNLPPPAEALAHAVAFAERALNEGANPVIVGAVDAAMLELAHALTAARLAVRAHASLLKFAGVYARAGAPAVALARFGRSLAAREVLLWPASCRGAATLAQLSKPRFALASGFAQSEAVLARAGATVALPLVPAAPHADLLAYVRATGARQVATVNDVEGRFAQHLRGLGFDAYTLGPPAQMPLFAAQAAL